MPRFRGTGDVTVGTADASSCAEDCNFRRGNEALIDMAGVGIWVGREEDPAKEHEPNGVDEEVHGAEADVEGVEACACGLSGAGGLGGAACA